MREVGQSPTLGQTRWRPLPGQRGGFVFGIYSNEVAGQPWREDGEWRDRATIEKFDVSRGQPELWMARAWVADGEAWLLGHFPSESMAKAAVEEHFVEQVLADAVRKVMERQPKDNPAWSGRG